MQIQLQLLFILKVIFLITIFQEKSRKIKTQFGNQRQLLLMILKIKATDMPIQYQYFHLGQSE